MKSQERKKLLLGKLKELSSEIVTNPEKLRKFAERWRGGFRQYSFHNLMLIWCQKSKATMCAGMRQWNLHKRWVKKGEHAIWILAPGFAKKTAEKKNDGEDVEEVEEKTISFFFPVPVFDYSQTLGQELLIGNTEVKGNGDFTLEDVASKFPYKLEVSQGLEDGSTDGKRIRVCRRNNPAQEVACYFHEVAHILLGHLDKRKEKVSREVAELEAESASYLVCSCLGIENDGAKKYLGHWNGDKEKVESSAMKIIKVSEEILRKARPDLFNKSAVVAC